MMLFSFEPMPLNFFVGNIMQAYIMQADITLSIPTFQFMATNFCFIFMKLEEEQTPPEIYSDVWGSK